MPSSSRMFNPSVFKHEGTVFLQNVTKHLLIGTVPSQKTRILNISLWDGLPKESRIFRSSWQQSCHLIVFPLHRYDPHATQFIRFMQLSDFIASLDPPLGIPKPNIVALVSFNLPIARGNKIHCLDILHSLVKYVLGHVEETEDFRKVRVPTLTLSGLWELGCTTVCWVGEINTEVRPLDVFYIIYMFQSNISIII